MQELALPGVEDHRIRRCRHRGSRSRTAGGQAVGAGDGGSVLPDEDEPLKLCRLAGEGSPDTRSFAIYEYSGDRYTDCMLPGGGLTGTPEAALDCACGLYLNDPSAFRLGSAG